MDPRLHALLGTVPTPENETAWYDVIGKFKAKADEFDKLRADLEKNRVIAAKDPALQTEYNDLMDRSLSIRDKIRSITSSVNGAWQWLKDAVGLDGLNELGFLPLIPIAVVAGSVTLMVKWISDAYEFNRKMEEIAKLQSKGVSAQQAANIVGQAGGGFSLFSAGTVSKVLLVGGVGTVLYLIAKKKGVV